MEEQSSPIIQSKRKRMAMKKDSSNTVPLFKMFPRPANCFEAKEFPVCSQIVLGRGLSDSAKSDNGLFKSLQVSRHHASLSFEDAKFYLKDLGSLNGTFLNEVRVNAGEKVALNCNDILQLGKHGAIDMKPMVGMLELHPCSCIGIHDSIIQDSLAGGGNMDQKSSKMEEEEFSQELMPMSEVLRSVRVARAEEKMMKEKEEELKEKHLREKVDQADDQDIDDPDLFSTF